MSKYLIPIGIVWVGFALVVGVVIVVSAPKSAGYKPKSVSTEHPMKTVSFAEEHTINLKTAVAIAGTPVGQQVTTEVRVQK